MKTLFILSSLFLAIRTAPTLQAVSVTGKFFCGAEPAVNIQVKLIERDYGRDRDDLLDEQRTDENGEFKVIGATHENGPIEPAIKIYHDCNDGEQKCQKRLFWLVPAKYVSVNLSSVTVFDLGTINLELGFGNEKRDCKH